MELVTKRIDGEEFVLAPIGDIQYGSSYCDVAKLARHIQFGIDHDWHFLGMGDYLDHFSPSNKAALDVARVGTLYDSAQELLDDAVKSRVEELADILDAPGRWLGLLYGDHSWTFADGQPADALLARKLGGDVLGFSTLMEVYVGKCPVPLTIFAHHKSGGPSVNPTGKTLDLQRKSAGFEGDIYLQGHSHLKYGVPVPRKEMVRHKGKAYLANHTRILGVTGSWLESYTAGARDANGWPTGSYAEQNGMNPLETGGIVITCKPVEEEYGWRWDMFVSA